MGEHRHWSFDRRKKAWHDYFYDICGIVLGLVLLLSFFVFITFNELYNHLYWRYKIWKERRCKKWGI